MRPSLKFRALSETRPGSQWAELFALFWPAYEGWFLYQGEASRPGYLTSVKALKKAMPELVPIYEELVELAGGGDLPARFLTLYCPPPFIAGCSQMVVTRGSPMLIRNYDFSPVRCEGTVWKSRWGKRSVIAMGDCLWGALDGINSDGLAVSISFGGCRESGEGFGIPLIVRYLLETCSSTRQAQEALQRLRSHMAYNVTVVDLEGRSFTAFLHPRRSTEFLERTVVTNHQHQLEWPAYAAMSGTETRLARLEQLHHSDRETDELVEAFLKPPLYARHYHNGCGTLYTAVYRPAAGAVEYRWPGLSWSHSFEEFHEGALRVYYNQQEGAVPEGGIETHSSQPMGEPV